MVEIAETMAARKSSKRKASRANGRGPRADGQAWLRRLAVHTFRHVEPCELHFAEGFNVLLGLNGTGKTTLLEIIAAALRFDFSQWRMEPFWFEYEIALPEGTLAVLVRNEALQRKKPSAVVGPAIAGPTVRPSFQITLLDRRGNRRFAARADESGNEVELAGRASTSRLLAADVLHKQYWISAVVAAATELAQASDQPIRRLVLRTLMRWAWIQRFDEGLGFLGAVTGQGTRVIITASDGEVYELGPLPVSIVDTLRERSRRSPAASVPSLSLSTEECPVLAQTARTLGFARVDARLVHLQTEVDDSKEIHHYGNLSFMLTRADGSAISHELLSYGQKRALSFLCYLDANPATVIADELVDGLHHAWIDAAVAAIGKRQAFLASQNPLLLDYLEFDSAEKVQNSFIQCRLRRDKKGTDRMLWANMSEYDAARFFDAYQVGLQHVSEILITRGLW